MVGVRWKHQLVRIILASGEYPDRKPAESRKADR